jgi:hypothetical protein
LRAILLRHGAEFSGSKPPAGAAGEARGCPHFLWTFLWKTPAQRPRIQVNSVTYVKLVNL